MLRQLFRTRGAYNVVNLPMAASQDDPGSNPGRADRSFDWRLHSALTEAQNDTRESWQQPYWYTDNTLTSSAAASILRKRLETFGPQRERNLQEVIDRIQNKKDAEMALKAAEMYRLRKAGQEQHTPLKISTSKLIIQRALEVDARDVIIQVLTRKDELGFSFGSLRAYRLAITHFSVKGDLKNVLRVFELAKKQGHRPNRDITFCVLRACLDCKRPDLAYAYAEEFQANGLRISPAQRILIEGAAGKMLPPFPGDSSSEVGTETTLPPSETLSRANSDSIVESEAILAEADRIIAASREAAVSKSGLEQASVNAEGVPEIPIKETSAVATEPAVTQENTESDPGSQGGSRKVVAAASIEPLSKQEVLHAAQSSPNNEEDQALLNLIETPGMEEAVKARVLLLFPEKEKKIDPLRRSNSM